MKKAFRAKRGSRGGRRTQRRKKKIGKGVFNLSTKELTTQELSILDKGLKFAPQKRLDKFHTFIDIHKFVRKINIKRYIASNSSHSLHDFERAATSGTVYSGLSNPSLFSPPVPPAPTVTIFRDLVLKDLAKLPPKKIFNQSFPMAGFKSLCDRKNLVVRPADKGGGIVIQDRPDYVTEMYRILSDQDTYRELPSNPTTLFKKELDKLILKSFNQHILNQKEMDYLVPIAPRTLIMYHLPKIHKDSSHPPGCPIISGIDSVTSRIGRYVDFYLQPIVKCTTSCLKTLLCPVHTVEH